MSLLMALSSSCCSFSLSTLYSYASCHSRNRHEFGEVGNLLQRFVVVRVVQQQQLPAVARPIIPLLRETGAHHFVDEVGELGAERVGELGERVDHLVVVLLQEHHAVLHLLVAGDHVQRALSVTQRQQRDVDQTTVHLVHQERLGTPRGGLHDGDGAVIQRGQEVGLGVRERAQRHLDVLLEVVRQHHQRVGELGTALVVALVRVVGERARSDLRP